ncbi:sensor histidine kinase [Sediminibacillus massiliensis]|uniref:sensor histidine kinase n=1 Tax=Sediminibacillus massiliensis TaxID=1926277 RepID=UPI0009887500|nr:sensor histidine kinase [Sediminibacillus massiliensis]
MRTVVQRSTAVGIVFGLFMLATLMAVFFVAFPVNDWTALWERKVMQLPFAVFAVLLSLLSGAAFGISEGLFWRRQIEQLSASIKSLKQGNKMVQSPVHSLEELNELWAEIENVQTYILTQKKLTQKLTTERVEDQEEKIEQVISAERNRLARELHDSVSQELFAASMMMSAVNEMSDRMEETTSAQLRQVETMIQQSQLEMRALLLHLRPAPLRDKSLQAGMEQLLAELKQKVPIEISWKMDEVSLRRGIEDHLFRILQESVSNTLRHAKAHSLDVLLLEREGMAILRVMDDGVGFRSEEQPSGSSYGLQNIKERASEIGASVKIVSVPDKGTRLEVRVPIIDIEGDNDD